MSAAEAFVAPDLADAVEVWRVWRVIRRAGTYQLGSVLKPTLWPRDEPLVAECLHPQPWSKRVWRRAEQHQSPELRCECGIYGADLGRVSQYLTPAPFEVTAARVLGRVSLWGTVFECERGYRASRAYPLAIYVPMDAARNDRRLEDLAMGLADYGVPVELLEESSVDAPGALLALSSAAGSGSQA
jgi:hypothetical protein